MDFTEKNKAQLIEEIEHLQKRIKELETSLSLYQDESIQRMNVIESSHDYLQSIIDNIADPILVVDHEYRVVLANRRTREIAGGIDPVKTGLFCYQVSHHRTKPCAGKSEPCPLKKILKTKAPLIVTHTHYDSEGRRVIVEIHASPVMDKKGTVIHMIELCRDITERKNMEEAIRGSEARYRSLFEQSSDAIFLLQTGGSSAGKILSVNRSACLMHGYTMEELLRLSIADVAEPDAAKKGPKYIKRILEGEIIRFETRHRKKDGSVFPVEVIAGLLKLDNQNLVLEIDRDISERKQTEEERNGLIKELEYMSQIDGLTGLLNRQHLDKRLSEEISRTKRYRNNLSILMFDIDNFKEINDRYGHVTGDKLLQKIATVLKETLRDTDIAGRFGGDEFIVILVQTDINVGIQVAQRFLAQIEKARITSTKRRSISFSVSMGICQYNNKIENLEDFIAKADEALYKAKHSTHHKICRAKD